MVRLDGNAVFLSAYAFYSYIFSNRVDLLKPSLQLSASLDWSRYNRNATISKNDVSWNGDTAFAAWGITGKCVNEKCDKKLDWPVGPDGRNGEQPRGTRVIGNMVRELGIWQKQSSMWFQAVTAQTHLAGNVHFNGPRAGLNFVRMTRAPALLGSYRLSGSYLPICLLNNWLVFLRNVQNDGFGGADVIEHNLLANCVRESGDHGEPPFRLILSQAAQNQPQNYF
jgi:hypothetical protein